MSTVGLMQKKKMQRMAHLMNTFKTSSPLKNKARKRETELEPSKEWEDRKEEKNPKGLLNSVRIISTDFFSFLYKKKGAEILFF